MRWKGAETPTFTPPHQPGQATYIDLLTFGDPKHLAGQIKGTTTLTISFLDHKGILGTIRIPVLTEGDTATLLTRKRRVHTFKSSVPEQDMETWRSKVAVDSATATALASAMARTLLDSLSRDNNQGQHDTSLIPQGVEATILSIASDLETILGEAMTTATTKFPQKPVAPKKGTLPQHLWPKSVRRDVDKIRRWVKTHRRLASIAAHHLEDIISDISLHDALWSEVITPVLLRTDLSPPPRDLASLGILHKEDLVAGDDAPPSHL